MASSTKTTSTAEKFGPLCHGLADTMRWTFLELAHRMGVSAKTLTRYANGHPPPPARARDMVQQLTGIDPVFHARIAASLGVPLPASITGVSASNGPVDPSRARSVIDAAILDASEQLNLVPGTTRAVGRMLLDAMKAAGLDLDTAREHLNVKPKRVS